MLMGKKWNDLFKEFVDDTGLGMGCVIKMLDMADVTVFEQNPEIDMFDESYTIDSDDHERLMNIDSLRETAGVWLDGNQVTQWVSKNSDAIHTYLWEHCDNYNENMWTLFERAKCDNEVSWLLEDILQGKIENIYNINRFLGWFVCDELLQQYQNIMGDLENE